MILAELFDFDVLAFTETWLNPNIASDGISLIFYHHPELKDRVADNHGGVIVYIKDSIHYVRRSDLEPNGVECIWVELTLSNHQLIHPQSLHLKTMDRLLLTIWTKQIF